MTRLSMAMLLACLIITLHLPAQDKNSLSDKVLSFPSRFLDLVGKKSSRLEDNIINKSERALKQLAKQERRLQRKLSKKDSALAKQLFQGMQAKYQSLQAELKNPVDKANKRPAFNPLLDTLTTSIRFLEKSNIITDNKLIQQTLGHVSNTQNRLEQADQIKQYLRDRRQYLKEQFAKLGMVKELRSYSKKFWYYGAQMDEYKSMLKEPDKIERKAIDLLSKTKPFQDFMRKYSILGSLFPSNDVGSVSNQPALPGLQTSAQVNSLIQQTIAGPNNSMQSLQSGIQQAQAQLQQVKNKINQMGANSDGDIPEFRPNNQKVKSFFKRLEFGTNLQSTRSNMIVPASSQIGLSMGYKLNDRSVIGVGAASSIAWGRDIKHIALSYNGASIRSYFDWRMKGSFWLSGAYELNHQEIFTRIEQLKGLNTWQQSGLIGISKKYQISKKFKGKMSLLWDALSYSQIPRTQPIIFRFGYTLK